MSNKRPKYAEAKVSYTMNDRYHGHRQNGNCLDFEILIYGQYVRFVAKKRIHHCQKKNACLYIEMRMK